MVPAARRFLLRHPSLLSVVVALYGEKFRRRYGCTVRLGHDGKSFAIRKKQRELWMSIHQNTYIPDAVQRLDYYIDAIEPELMNGVEVGDFREPRMHAVRGVKERFKFTSFPESAEIADAYLKIFRVKPGHVIIDAGAYCGLTGFLFSRAVGPAGRVIAIEADPRNFECLADNMRRLGAGNVDILHAAVWREKGHVDFASEGNMGSAVLKVSPTKAHRVSVKSLTLVDIADTFELSRVDHVKVDIEGAEYEALPAAAPFIKRYRPDFLVETHLENDGPVNVAKLEEFFSGLGYQMKIVPQPGDEIFPLLYFWPKNRGNSS